ncbi:hypothetical protein Esti_001124 [Eimeria stiedai]
MLQQLACPSLAASRSGAAALSRLSRLLLRSSSRLCSYTLCSLQRRRLTATATAAATSHTAATGAAIASPAATHTDSNSSSSSSSSSSIDMRAVHRHHWAVPVVGFDTRLALPLRPFEVWEDEEPPKVELMEVPSEVFGRPLRPDILHQVESGLGV